MMARGKGLADAPPPSAMADQNARAPLRCSDGELPKTTDQGGGRGARTLFPAHALVPQALTQNRRNTGPLFSATTPSSSLQARRGAVGQQHSTGRSERGNRCANQDKWPPWGEGHRMMWTSPRDLARTPGKGLKASHRTAIPGDRDAARGCLPSKAAPPNQGRRP